jgi:hypothetical protein
MVTPVKSLLGLGIFILISWGLVIRMNGLGQDLLPAPFGFVYV